MASHSISVPPETWALVRDLARSEGVTMGEVTRRLVEAASLPPSRPGHPPPSPVPIEAGACPVTGARCICHPDCRQRLACATSACLVPVGKAKQEP